jgi:hypothetical protein
LIVAKGVEIEFETREARKLRREALPRRHRGEGEFHRALRRGDHEQASVLRPGQAHARLSGSAFVGGAAADEVVRPSGIDPRRPRFEDVGKGRERRLENEDHFHVADVQDGQGRGRSL